jgi:hypothetical protein
MPLKRVIFLREVRDAKQIFNRATLTVPKRQHSHKRLALTKVVESAETLANTSAKQIRPGLSRVNQRCEAKQFFSVTTHAGARDRYDM